MMEPVVQLLLLRRRFHGQEAHQLGGVRAACVGGDVGAGGPRWIKQTLAIGADHEGGGAAHGGGGAAAKVAERRALVEAGEGAGAVHVDVAVQAQPGAVDGAEDDGVAGGAGLARVRRGHGIFLSIIHPLLI